MTTRHDRAVSTPPNIRPAIGGTTTTASDCGVNAATSMTTSRRGSCGGSMRSDCQTGRPPGSVPTHAVDEIPGSDSAATSASWKNCRPRSGRLKPCAASSVARIDFPIR
jgi:hypothetical protein